MIQPPAFLLQQQVAPNTRAEWRPQRFGKKVKKKNQTPMTEKHFQIYRNRVHVASLLTR
jgi:hypothetical protein